ncbi:hypothetical protein OEZ85_005871 [Tetradesmus obliquus]|uniref:Ubiquinone biosynthesis protein n=1 Tax=Tetradesmus obliquus TaxID=3088 RepID=A0ABY8UG21_TETOB|nr:hypothetical protein OEZ85_005871 [Tetradesmus obliquus]
MVLRRSLVRWKKLEPGAVQAASLQSVCFKADEAAEAVADKVAAGGADGHWDKTYVRLSKYETLPGVRSCCAAAAAGQISDLAEAALAAGRAGPVAAYGLAVTLVREALGKLPTLEQIQQQQQQEEGAAVLGSLAAAGPPLLDGRKDPLQQWGVLLQLARTDLLQLAPDMRPLVYDAEQVLQQLPEGAGLAAALAARQQYARAMQISFAQEAGGDYGSAKTR